MKRLPSYDSDTERTERGLFVILCLAAAGVIAISGWNGLQLSTRSQDENRATPATEITARTEQKPITPSTNLTIYRPGATGERSRLNGLGAPKS